MNVVVIGAGVAGLAIGWRLAQAGAAVTVLERALPGRGATWAAAGMIAATAEAGEAQTPEAELAYRARAMWPDFARDVEEASGLAVGYAQNGALMVAMREAEAAHQAARAAQDAELALLSKTDARAMEPLLSEAAFGALWVPKEAQVDNRALGEALARAFRRAGGTLVVNEAAVRIETYRGRAVGVRTPFGVYGGDAFVLAAGAWSGLIDGLPRDAIPPVKPMKGEMLALTPPAGVAIPKRVVWGNEVYLVPRGARLLIGATLEDKGFDTALTDAAEDWLTSRALTLMPGLRDWTIDEHWAGLRPGSPDGLPMLGETALGGLFVATGQHRNGILFAPAVAETLVRSVLEQVSEKQPFDPRRFAGPLAPSPALR
ncbi:MAG TPA: glycine oxidase ThiO [Rhizomicrobium sp.]|nr:glycine oxidase ThiO [Rhizomicrobium sp.]